MIRRPTIRKISNVHGRPSYGRPCGTRPVVVGLPCAVERIPREALAGVVRWSGVAMRISTLLSIAGLGLGLLGSFVRSAAADPPRKVVESKICGDCSVTYHPHQGDVWVESFYEVPNSRKAPTTVRYTMEICWRRFWQSKEFPDDCAFCGVTDKGPVLLEPDIELTMSLFHSRLTAPKGTAGSVPITGFEIGENHYDTSPELFTVCRSLTTPALPRPTKLGNPSWLVVRTKQSDQTYQEDSLANNIRQARADLRVEPLGFTSVFKDGKHYVNQTLKICNGAGNAETFKVGFSVGHAVTAAAKPGPWTRLRPITGGIKARKCKTITHKFVTPVGMFRGFVKADVKDAVLESTESNNIVSFDYGAVEVSGTTPPTGRKKKKSRSGKSRGGKKAPEAPSRGQGGGTPAPPEAPSRGRGGGGGPA